MDVIANEFRAYIDVLVPKSCTWAGAHAGTYVRIEGRIAETPSIAIDGLGDVFATVWNLHVAGDGGTRLERGLHTGSQFINKLRRGTASQEKEITSALSNGAWAMRVIMKMKGSGGHGAWSDAPY